MSLIYENTLFKVVQQEHNNPWVIVYVKSEPKEFSELDVSMRNELMQLVYLIEKVMLEYYQADKINIASFGNYLPRLHMHVQARFKEDDHFPESLWGVKQREGFKASKPFEGFRKVLKECLRSL